MVNSLIECDGERHNKNTSLGLKEQMLHPISSSIMLGSFTNIENQTKIS